jgi:hypothetical protein
VRIVHHIPPFHFIQMGGRHIHHLVLGIVILLLVGYGWLCEIGVGSDGSSIFLSRLMPEGRASIDAIILFGALLAASAWGAPLLTGSKKRQKVATSRSE